MRITPQDSTGLEPVTTCLIGTCSTIELRRNSDLTAAKLKESFPGENWRGLRPQMGRHLFPEMPSQVEAAGVEPTSSRGTNPKYPNTSLPGKLCEPEYKRMPSGSKVVVAAGFEPALAALSTPCLCHVGLRDHVYGKSHPWWDSHPLGLVGKTRRSALCIHGRLLKWRNAEGMLPIRHEDVRFL